MSEKSLKLLLIGLLICLACYLNAARYRPARDLAYAMDLVSDSYVDDVTGAALKNAALEGMLESLDPNSSYVPEESLGRFNSLLEQRFAGLGVQLAGPPTHPAFTVVATLYNSPAFRKGILPGDQILQVDGVELGSMDTTEVSKRLTGAVGTAVRLTLDRAGQRIDVQVTREYVEVESVTGDRRLANGSWNFLLEKHPKIAYLHANLFGEKTAGEIENAIKSLDGSIQALILDLRDNGGGLLQAAVQTCDLFLNDGVIVSTEGRGGKNIDTATAQPGTILLSSIPIAVIINSNSASASEIVAACLKDRERAIIVGERSYGKGSVQSVIPVEGGRAAIRFTTAYYYPPSRRRIHKRAKDSPEDEWGVMPSPGAEVVLTEDQLNVATERMRRRSEPLRNGVITDHPLAKVEDPEDRQLAEDAQLVKAIEMLEAKIR